MRVSCVLEISFEIDFFQKPSFVFSFPRRLLSSVKNRDNIDSIGGNCVDDSILAFDYLSNMRHIKFDDTPTTLRESANELRPTQQPIDHVPGVFSRRK